jgi:aminoglycoside/choline kinase family phosphotransferase
MPHDDDAPRAGLLASFLESCGWGRAVVTPIASDASFRRYSRVRDGGQTRILMDAPPSRCESVAQFVFVDRTLIAFNLKAPDVYAVDAENGFVLMEDLGRESFSSVLSAASGRQGEERELYEYAGDVLHHIARYAAPSGLPEYSEELLMREAMLLPEWYLPFLFPGKDFGAASEEYAAIWRRLLPLAAAETPVLVHRDYHADNLMWMSAYSGVKKVGLLDFQDAVIGNGVYDLASLLEDVRRRVSDDVIRSVKARYAEDMPPDGKERFEREYALLSAQRNCKILGIFVRLAVRDGKPRYPDYLPEVWRVLERALAHPVLREMKAWLDEAAPPALRTRAG